MENKKKTKEELVEEFSAIIKANPNFENFFQGYRPSSVNSFIRNYALKKAFMVPDGPIYKKILNDLEMEWENGAIKRLEEILQVKLFLFQCRFRAETLDEPAEEIRTTFDFLYWKENILNARFLEPISEQDVELYLDYMNSPDATHQPLGFLQDWQNFDCIRRGYNDDEEDDEEEIILLQGFLPAWYEFYFSRTGHGFELKLPDIRGKKDNFYFQIGNKERSRLYQEAQKKAIEENPLCAPEKGNFFNGSEEDNMQDFLNTFEDEEGIELYKLHEEWSKFIEKEEIVYNDLNMLMYAKEPVPVENNENWIEAILVAAANYRTKKIIESMPAAYAQYKMNLDLNITFPEKEKSREQQDFYNSMILLGRKLNGEPEDFKY